MMMITETLDELRRAKALLTGPLGLVPTMGYLHEGHLSLVRRAREQCRGVIATIFVNPTQFGPGEDFDTYPRDIPKDLALLEEAGADIVWIPSPAEMYPADYQTWITVEEVTKMLEGSLRSGHFRGVTTVVAKLFNAAQPQKAYFGQKDAQQTVVIRQMARDLNFNIDIVVCPTIREADGLAMSSRNYYLNHEERGAAGVLYRALNRAREAYSSGEQSAGELRRLVQETLSEEPLAEPLYISCARADTLEEIDTWIEGRALLSLAVRIGKTRLIDNMILGEYRECF